MKIVTLQSVSGARLKIVTLQSVSGARLKIAAFGKITHSVTYIVALLEKKRRICPKPILKRVKALGTEVLPCDHISPQ